MMAEAAGTTCAGKPAQKGHPLKVERMMGLHTAAMMLGGIEKLAGALDIQERGTRAKISGERGVSDADLLATAAALDERADRVRAHAEKLRQEAQAA